MAAPSNLTRKRIGGPRESEDLLATVVEQLNNTIEALRIVTAQLDADGTVTDTDYFANSVDDAVATAPQKIDLS